MEAGNGSAVTIDEPVITRWVGGGGEGEAITPPERRYNLPLENTDYPICVCARGSFDTCGLSNSRLSIHSAESC